LKRFFWKKILDHLSKTILETVRSGCSQNKLQGFSHQDFEQFFQGLQESFFFLSLYSKTNYQNLERFAKIFFNKKNLQFLAGGYGC